MKRVTRIFITWERVKRYFNPHPLWRGWQFFHTLYRFAIKFQSTPSVKRVTRFCQFLLNKIYLFQSTPSVKRVTVKISIVLAVKELFQSTPSVKRVTIDAKSSYDLAKISIHTLCEEGDLQFCTFLLKLVSFQSTPSVKRVTIKIIVQGYSKNFNPHPLWRGWLAMFTIILLVL